MKYYFAVLSFIAVISLSCTGPKMQEAAVIKDCTGSYLRINNKDYHVCNIEKLEGLENGVKIKASYRRLEKCTGPEQDAIVCMMYHENEGWIKIKKIKKQ